MLTMNPDKRYDIDQVLSHKFMTFTWPESDPEPIEYIPKFVWNLMPLELPRLTPPSPKLTDSVLLQSQVRDLTKVYRKH